MSKRKFNISYKRGFRGLPKKDAPAFISVLSDIAKEMGSPGEAPSASWRQALVEKARPIDSPIHHNFVWDDVEAGEKYREHQAAYYIRAFEFQYIDERGDAVSPKVRWIQNIELVTSSDRTHNSRVAMTMPQVLSNKQALDRLVETALGEMRSWVRRHEALQKVAKLAPIFLAARRALAHSEPKKRADKE